METLEQRSLLSATLTHYDGAIGLPSGFVTSVVAEGRIGNIGSATFEADIGQSTSAPHDTIEFGDATTHWQAGQAKAFTFTVDGNGNASYTINGQTITYTGAFSGTELRLRVRANNATNTVALSNLVLDGVALNDTATSSGKINNQEILRISDADLADGFTLTGDATMTWTGNMPLNSNMAFQISWAAAVELQTATVTSAVWSDETVTANSGTVQSLDLAITDISSSVPKASILLTATVLPNVSGALGKVFYEIRDANGGFVDDGAFTQTVVSKTLNGQWDADTSYTIYFGVDRNGNNQLDAGERVRQVDADVKKVTISASSADARFNNGTITVNQPPNQGQPIDITLVVKSNEKPLPGFVFNQPIVQNGAANPNAQRTIASNGQLVTNQQGEAAQTISILAPTDKGTFLIGFQSQNDPSLIYVITIVVQ